MNLLHTVPDSAMVAAFLKAELYSERFSADLKQAMQHVGVGEALVVHPDLHDDRQNELRAALLGQHRGYQQGHDMFEGVPERMTWYAAELSRDEIGQARYVDYDYWNELTDHTRLVKEAVRNIQNGKTVFDVSNDRFLAVAEQIKRHGYSFEPMILWATDRDAPLELLEGHLRATAYYLAGEQAPHTIRAIVGFAR